MVGCQNPAIEEHSERPMILAACYEEPPVEGHEGNWALIDLGRVSQTCGVGSSMVV